MMVTRPSRRDAIVEAAIRVFSARSFDGASIADVAAASGVAPAAVYYHFESKHALLAEAVRTVGDAISRVVSDGPGDLDAIVARVFDWAAEHPSEVEMFYLWSVGASPAVTAVREDFAERHVRGLATLLRTRRPTMADRLAVRTAIATAIAASAAWLSDDVFPAQAGRAELVTALTDALRRIIGLSSAAAPPTDARPTD